MQVKEIAGSVFTIDPHNVYNNDMACMETCGLLLDWLWDAAEFGDDPEEGHVFLHDALAESYPYHMGWRECRVGAPDQADVRGGRFCYPGDPELSPLLSVKRGSEEIYIYPHAIVAVVLDDEQPIREVKWTRMD